MRVQELCESRAGRPGLPVPNGSYGLCGRKATLNPSLRPRELCESRGVRPGLPSPSLKVLMVSVDVKQTLNLSVNEKNVNTKGSALVCMNDFLPQMFVVVGLNKVYSHIVIINSTNNRYRKHKSICCCCCNLMMFHEWA